MNYIIEGEGIRLIKPSAVIDVIDKLDNVIEKTRKKKSWKEAKFVISFLFWTGTRVSEMLLTKRKDIDLVTRLYYVPTLKKKKEIKLTVPLSHVPDKILRFWDLYFAEAEIGLEDRIVTKTRQGIHTMVKRTFETFGYKGIHPHMLRHSIAVLLALNGFSINALQRFLRHSKAENTAIYYRISGQDLIPLLQKIKNKIEYGQITLI